MTKHKNEVRLIVLFLAATVAAGACTGKSGTNAEAGAGTNAEAGTSTDAGTSTEAGASTDEDALPPDDRLPPNDPGSYDGSAGPVSVTVSPTAASLAINSSRTFQATVTGSTNTGVNWSVEEGTSGGSITSGGTYTAPGTTGTYHVVATSAAEPSRSARATVIVTGSQPGVEHTYPKNSGPDKNPHKGWNSGWSESFPEATVGFQYLAWKDFEPRKDEFDFAKVEEILGRKGSVGQHFVLRLYGDWAPNDASSNCPDWLFSQVGVKRLAGDNGAHVTDYNDPNYVSEAVKAIQALAQRYNDDPRVHAFELGVLGYWGEWHTSGFKAGGVAYTISDTAKNAIINAYKTYFTKVQIQGRYPWREPLKSAGGMGFHNDYFVPNNSHSDEFDNGLNAGGQWRNGPLGGHPKPAINGHLKTGHQK